jgi:hypothetical protein
MGIFDSYIGAAPESITAMQNAQNAVLTTGIGSYETRSEMFIRGGHHLRVDISKVSNGYVVSFDEERFIAENAEQVNGIISAQLLKLGAK